MRGQDPEKGAPARAGVPEASKQAEAHVEAEPRELPSPSFSQTVLGWLTAESTASALVVDFAGNPSGPLAARATIRLDEAAIHHAIATLQPAALVFENGDARLPIVLGLLQAAPSPLVDLLRSEASPEPVRSPPIEAHVDGKRVVITAEKEITLECGEASLTLRRDGKILLRGTYVETYARGINRIKGAQVKIN